MGIPAIFVPFFLVHDRLRELERRMMLEVEGETPEWFMKLMRHEAAHAYSYAYRLYRRRKWQETFGLASTEESEFYRPRPYSRSYVVHLDDWYAQSHPDEDFAETFAVWLTPDLDWREAVPGLEGAAKARVCGRADAVAGGEAAAASAGLSRGRLRLPQHQAQDLLRPEAKALRGRLPGFLRRRSAPTVRRRRPSASGPSKPPGTCGAGGGPSWPRSVAGPTNANIASTGC